VVVTNMMNSSSSSFSCYLFVHFCSAFTDPFRAVRVHCAGARSAIRLDIFITKLDLMEHLVMAVYLP
jgi:hypothetical protein